MSRKKPFELRIAEGDRNKGKNPIPAEISRCSEHPLKMPEGLDDYGKSAWNSVMAARHFDMLGADSQGVVEAYCRTYSRFRQVDDLLNTDGMTVEGKNGLRKNPLMGEFSVLASSLLRYAGDLGLSPSGRTKIRVEPKAQHTPDKSILGGPKVKAL